MEAPDRKTPESNAPTPRSVGFGLLFVALLVFGANEFMLLMLGRYFPLILLLAGPSITFGVAILIHPGILDALSQESTHPKWLRMTSLACLALGVMLGVLLMLKANYG